MTAEDLLRSALDPAALLDVLQRAAGAWEVESDRARRRPSCGLCLADRPWIADLPALAVLPHAVSHPLVAHIDAALQVAEFDEDEVAEVGSWTQAASIFLRDAEVESSMRAFELRARETILTVIDGLEPSIAALRESVVEPRLDRYLERHTMTEPPWPWPWTLE